MTGRTSNSPSSRRARLARVSGARIKSTACPNCHSVKAKLPQTTKETAVLACDRRPLGGSLFEESHRHMQMMPAHSPPWRNDQRKMIRHHRRAERGFVYISSKNRQRYKEKPCPMSNPNPPNKFKKGEPRLAGAGRRPGAVNHLTTARVGTECKVRVVYQTVDEARAALSKVTG